jgi:hypothetical protein
MSGRRPIAALGAIGVVVALAAACTTEHAHEPYCDYRTTHCRTVCDQYCDDFGCYPDCYDTCWDECTVVPPAPDAASDAPGEASDGAPIEGGAEGGTGVVCSPCTSNADCTPGIVCFIPGGVDAGGGRCGSPPSSCP